MLKFWALTPPTTAPSFPHFTYFYAYFIFVMTHPLLIIYTKFDYFSFPAIIRELRQSLCLNIVIRARDSSDQSCDQIHPSEGANLFPNWPDCWAVRLWVWNNLNNLITILWYMYIVISNLGMLGFLIKQLSFSMRALFARDWFNYQFMLTV